MSKLTARTADEQKVDLCSLLREGHIFAINYESIDYFPDYAFDACDGYQPVPALKAVIKVLATRRNAWGMAL